MTIVDMAVIVSYSVFVDILWGFILVHWGWVGLVGWSWSMIRCWSWSMIRCWSWFVAVGWSWGWGFVSCGNSSDGGKGYDL